MWYYKERLAGKRSDSNSAAEPAKICKFSFPRFSFCKLGKIKALSFSGFLHLCVPPHPHLPSFSFSEIILKDSTQFSGPATFAQMKVLWQRSENRPQSKTAETALP